jgi:hypothetical protein
MTRVVVVAVAVVVVVPVAKRETTMLDVPNRGKKSYCAE